MYDNESGDNFVPPEPPPIKINNPVTALLLIGVIGAPLVWVIVGMLLTFEPAKLGIVCVLIFVGCFVAGGSLAGWRIAASRGLGRRHRPLVTWWPAPSLQD